MDGVDSGQEVWKEKSLSLSVYRFVEGERGRRECVCVSVLQRRRV